MVKNSCTVVSFLSNFKIPKISFFHPEKGSKFTKKLSAGQEIVCSDTADLHTKCPWVQIQTDFFYPSEYGVGINILWLFILYKLYSVKYISIQNWGFNFEWHLWNWSIYLSTVFTNIQMSGDSQKSLGDYLWDCLLESPLEISWNLEICENGRENRDTYILYSALQNCPSDLYKLSVEWWHG